MKTRPLIRNAVVLGAGVMLALLLAAASARSQTPPRLALPIDCQPGNTCFVQNYVDHDPSSTWRDYACGARSYDGHDGTDFRVPSMAAVRTGVAVLAAADGVVAGVRDGMKDVSIRETGKEAVKDRECGNGLVLRHADGWETQYCHLAQGSVSVRRGQTVRAGERLGRVGLSGLTEFPHLHLTVRHNGKAVDPFAPSPSAGACSSDATLWDDTAAAALVYRRRVMLNHGFSERVLSMAEVENQQPGEATPTSESPALIAYVRMIGLEAGDTAHIVLRAPAAASSRTSITPVPKTLPLRPIISVFMKKYRFPSVKWPHDAIKSGPNIARAGPHRRPLRHLHSRYRTPVNSCDTAHNLAATASSRERRLEPTLPGAPRISPRDCGPQ